MNTITTRKRRTKAQMKAERAAYHEAGHAVMAWLCNVQIDLIDMRGSDALKAGAWVALAGGLSLQTAVDIRLAGLAATELHEGCRSDLRIYLLSE